MLLAQFSEQKHGMGITWFSAAYFVSVIMKMIIVSVTIMVL